MVTGSRQGEPGSTSSFECVGLSHSDDGAEGNCLPVFGNFAVNTNRRVEEIGVTKRFTFCFSWPINTAMRPERIRVCVLKVNKRGQG